MQPPTSSAADWVSRSSLALSFRQLSSSQHRVLAKEASPAHFYPSHPLLRPLPPILCIASTNTWVEPIKPTAPLPGLPWTEQAPGQSRNSPAAWLGNTPPPSPHPTHPPHTHTHPPLQPTPTVAPGSGFYCCCHGLKLLNGPPCTAVLSYQASHPPPTGGAVLSQAAAQPHRFLLLVSLRWLHRV